MRRTVTPQTLPEHPEQRQSRYLAATRRMDELQRLLDLPSETVTGSIANAPTATASTASPEARRNNVPRVAETHVVAPQVGGPFAPADRPLTRPSAVSFAPSGEAAPHAASGPTTVARLENTAGSAGDDTRTIPIERRDLVTSVVASTPVPAPPARASDQIVPAPVPMPAPLISPCVTPYRTVNVLFSFKA